MIRKATIEDLPELMRMAFEFHKAAKLRRLASFEESTESWRAWLSKCIAGGPLLALIAEKEGATCGFLAGMIFPAYWNPAIKAAHECNIWVDPSARGNGVGGELIEAFTAWGCENGANIVASGSTVYMGPKSMARLLQKHGFSLEERTYSKRAK